MRSTLSFTKFLDIITKHSIELDKVFSRGNEIMFLQVKYYAYSFFIFMPDNYRMVLKKEIPHINIDYAEDANSITENFIKLMKIKLDSNLLVISNNSIFTSDGQSFKMTGKIRIHHNEVGLIDLLEKESKKLTNNISIKFSETEPTFNEETNVDLEFHDYDGTLIEKDSNYANMITQEEEGEEECENNNNYDFDYQNDNIVEWELKDYPLRIGKTFKTTPITDFFEDLGIPKIISDAEIFYNEIYQIEQEIRKEKFDEISDMYAILKQKYDDVYDYFEKQENILLNNKRRLQTVVSSLIFKRKINNESQINATDIIEKANYEIENIDIKLLKIRDEYNEYFDKCYSHYQNEIQNFKTPILDKK